MNHRSGGGHGRNNGNGNGHGGDDPPSYDQLARGPCQALRQQNRAGTAPDNRHRRKQEGPFVAVSRLQPRVAVVLNVGKKWAHLLYGCRLLSITPAIWWGVRCALRHLITELLADSGDGDGTTSSAERTARRLRIIETVLSIIWCGASSYLSFYFTDCLMTRWLINYAGPGTVVRLLTLSLIFSFVTSRTITLTGGDADPTMLLPAWVGIACLLIVCYHVGQRKINIRKETSASISVFSLASFLSMLALLVHLHLLMDPHPDVPAVRKLQEAFHLAGDLGLKILGVGSDRGRTLHNITTCSVL